MSGMEALLIAGAGASVLSGVMGASGAAQQARAAQQAANFQAEVQEQQAQAERDRAAVEAQDFRREGSRARAASLARMGASGTVASEGSPLLVDEAFVKELALGSARIQHGGEVRGTRLDQQAELTRAEGRSARRAGGINAGASLLSGLSGGASILSGSTAFS